MGWQPASQRVCVDGQAMLTSFIEAGLDIDLHMPVPLNVMIVETVHTLKYVPLIGLDPLLIQPRKHGRSLLPPANP